MDSFQALGLCENAMRFRVEVSFPNKEVFLFEVFTRYTVDKVKALVLSQAPEFSPLDYLLGVSENEKLEIEFAKFIVSHPKIKDALESDELVKIGLFKRTSAASTPKEKIELNADIDMAALRSNLQHVILSPKPSLNIREREKERQKQEKDVKKRRNSFSQLFRRDSDSSKEKEKKSALSSMSSFSLWGHSSKGKDSEGMARSSSANQLQDPSASPPPASPPHSPPSLPESPNNLRIMKAHLSSSSLLERQPYEPIPDRLSASMIVSPQLLPRTPSEIAIVKGYTYEESVAGTSFSPASWIITDPMKSQPWYNMYFYGKEHFNYIGIDGSDTVIVSAIKEDATTDTTLSTPDMKNGVVSFRVVIRTKKGDEKKCAFLKNKSSTKKKLPIKDVIQNVYPSLVGKKLSSIKDSVVCADLKNFEDRQLIRNYKFGVLYCANGQTDEEQMFSNVNGSADWDEFLDVLGTRVELLGWPNYRAGLDVKTGTTGTHSIHTRYKDYEIMFHVSTLLPFDTLNPQQLERKRHLGNDIVVVIFKEGNQQYDPNCIKSEFNRIQSHLTSTSMNCFNVIDK